MLKLFYFFTIILLHSVEIQSQPNLIIDLKQERNKSIHFDSDLVEYSFDKMDKFKSYNKYILDNYKGIPVLDSIKIQVFHLHYYKFLYDLKQSNYFSAADFNKFINDYDVDSTGISKEKINHSLLAVIGFKGNKQIIIADANNNFDFSDDHNYEFDINFRKDSENNLNNIKKLLPSNLVYQYQTNDKIESFNRKFVLYPNSNHIFAQKLKPSEKSYLTFIKFVDYWKGFITYKQNKYDFSLQPVDNRDGYIYVNNKKYTLSSYDSNYNMQFRHRLRDTINLSGDLFKIDSINANLSKLYLRKLTIVKQQYGYQVGNYIKNYKIEDLDYKNFKLFDSIKKYTLIEFWGTWCKSCRVFTPKLKTFYNQFSKNLSIVSLAVDNDKGVMKNYVAQHNINWKNGYIANLNYQKNEIIKDLKVQAFPTFILIDKNGKILHRGSINSFDKIIKIIK